MISAFADPTMPPLTPPEAQSPGLLALGKANIKDAMADPAKSKVMNALLQQSLSKMGQAFSAQPMTRQDSNPLDIYGQPVR